MTTWLAVAACCSLTRYAARQPGIHANADLTLGSGRYVFYQAARDTEAAEEQTEARCFRSTVVGKR